METEYQNSFIVMPADCNYHQTMIFGGFFMAKLDLAAAACVTRFLYGSPCTTAVTYKFSGTFHAAAMLGDLVFLHAKIIQTRVHAIVVEVKAYRERRINPKQERDFIAEAEFVFVSKKDDQVYPHEMKLA